MYSYEERKLAIDLYIKYNLRVNHVIKELGYPTRMTLRAWIDEVSPVSTKRCDTNKYLVRYSEEEKKKAIIRRYESYGVSIFTWIIRFVQENVRTLPSLHFTDFSD